MTARSGRPTEIAIGVLLLAQFAFITAVKLTTGEAPELLWMSHVSVALAGIGLLRRSDDLLGCVLVTLLVPHALWLFDLASWLLTGSFPLGIAVYLDGAAPVTWIATSHHLYLVPVLLLVVHRRRRLPATCALHAAGLCVLLLIAGRLMPPWANTNWAHACFPGIDLPVIHAVNRLPGALYLPIIGATVVFGCQIPSFVGLRILLARLQPPGTSPAGRAAANSGHSHANTPAVSSP